MNTTYYPLLVHYTIEEINGSAKTLIFDVPAGLSDVFQWKAGQHLSFRFMINDEELRRSYSISSSPSSDSPLQITVKRVQGGLVSNHINDVIKIGDKIDVMPPFGSFCLDTDRNERRTHYFFGAGSGITPLISMIQSVLRDEPYSVAYLLYGNKNADSILFREKLASLQKQFGKRLAVMHVLSSPSMWTQFDHWQKGRLDAPTIEAFLTEKPPYAQNAQYYVCGPGNMNASVTAALMSLDVPSNRIHKEHYGGHVESDDSIKGVAAKATITLNGSTHTVLIGSDETVLESARNVGLNTPYSCQSGVCGACRATLNTGTVHMRASMALDDIEIKDGAILTCQAIATSENLSLTYEQD